MKMPPKMGSDIPYGPRNKQQDWEQLRGLLHDVCMAAMTSDDSDVLPMFDYVYGLWANKAEQELAEATGTPPQTDCDTVNSATRDVAGRFI